MQFVQSVPVAEVLATEGNIQVWRNCFCPLWWSFSSTLPTHHWPAPLIYHRPYRASFGSMRPVKKDPMVSAQRWWTLTSRAAVSFLDRRRPSCKKVDSGSEMSRFVCVCSWVLCHHVHPRSRRQTLGQPAAHKDRSGWACFPLRCWETFACTRFQ